MSPAAVTIGAATLSRSPLVAHAERGDRDRDRQHDDRRDDRADRPRSTMKSTTEIAFVTPNAIATALGHDREQDRERHRQRDRGGEVLADERVDAPRQPERPGVDRGTEAAPERAEDVAPHADRRRDEDRSVRAGRSRVPVMEPSVRPVTRSPPDEIRSATNPARTPDGSARSERDEARADATREAKHWGLGGSFCMVGSKGGTGYPGSRLPRSADRERSQDAISPQRPSRFRTGTRRRAGAASGRSAASVPAVASSV